MAAVSAEDPPDFGDADEDETVAPEATVPEAGLGLTAATDAALAGVLGDVLKAPPAPTPAAALGAGPTVVPLMGGAPGAPQVVAPGGPGVVAPPAEDVLPPDSDGDGWLELLRDGFTRQLREENECDEPPPFHRAMQLAADPPIPAGKYPRSALNLQLQLLLRLRSGDVGGVPGKGYGKALTKGPGKGFGCGGCGGFGSPAALPHLLKQMQMRAPSMTPAQQGQQAQLLLAAAKALQQGSWSKGGGKGPAVVPGVQRTLGK